MTSQHPRIVRAALVSVLAMAVACAPAPLDTAPSSPVLATSSAPDVATPSPGTTGVSTASRIATVLGRLPPCDTVQDDGQTIDLDGLIMPAGSAVIDVTEEGNLTTVEALVPINPVEVRQFYEYQNLGVLKTIMVEDEILEAEVLVESRTHRLYVKAQAICPSQSTIYVVVAKGGTDARLPQPGDPNAPGDPPPSTPEG